MSARQLILVDGRCDSRGRETLARNIAAYRKTEAHALQWTVSIFAGDTRGAVRSCSGSCGARTLPSVNQAATLKGTFALLKNPRLAFGMLSIFIYVGAEVSIGSVMANYLMLPHTLGLVAERAGEMVSLYWGGAMIGRFIGAARAALCACGSCADVLRGHSLCSWPLRPQSSAGTFAAVTLLAIGLFNSIMFPTIFTIAIEGEKGDTPQASALLVHGDCRRRNNPLDHRAPWPIVPGCRWHCSCPRLLCLDCRLWLDRPQSRHKARRAGARRLKQISQCTFRAPWVKRPPAQFVRSSRVMKKNKYSAPARWLRPPKIPAPKVPSKCSCRCPIA